MDNHKKQCTAVNKSNGQQCKAWAMKGNKYCSVHNGHNTGRGGGEGNQNAGKHGFYGGVFTLEEKAQLIAYAMDTSLEDEVALTRVHLQRLSKYLQDMMDKAQKTDKAVSTEELIAIMELVASLHGHLFSGVRTVASLQKIREAMKEPGDNLASLIAATLNEIGKELGIDI